MKRLLAAAAGFAATVIGGFLVGVALTRATGSQWWIPVGRFGGLALGVAAIAAAVRPLLR